MNGFNLCKIIVGGLAILMASETVLHSENATANDLSRLETVGVQPSVVSDGVVHSFIVPSSWSGGRRDLDLLQHYCQLHNRSCHIRFVGPVICQERLRQFRVALPKARLEHEAAVGLGIVHKYFTHESRLIVTGVSPDSPASKAGVLKGDIIVGIGDYRWPEQESQDAYYFAIRKQIPGQRSTITVKRNGATLSLPITF